MPASSPFHEGEIAVQTHAGVQGQARRVGAIIRAQLTPDARDFVADQPFAVVSSVGADGRVWASLIAGEPGLLDIPDAETLHIAAPPFPGDPLAANLHTGGPIGVLVIDPATRRRIRVNGRAVVSTEAGFTLRVTEAFGNCPKYIQARTWEMTPQTPGAVTHTATLTPDQVRAITGADTFFVASAHPERGADASHRGGSPGFVRVVDAQTLIWPDYSGNRMFQTLGNLAVNPRAGLLFPDFARGDTLQLTGTATVDWDPEHAHAFPGAERLVQFVLDEAVAMIGVIPLRWQFAGASPFNPG